MLEAFGPELWLAQGPEVRFLGLFPYPTRMAVARLPDGGLWVWSPVALDPALRGELAALGPVRELVSPNKLHHLFLAAWQDAFPEARLHAPPGLARKRRDLHFAADLADAPDPAWQGAIDPVVFRGSVAMEEVAFFHHPSRSALVCDLVQRFDPATLRPSVRWLMRLDGLVGEAGSTPREWRASWWRRAGARAARDRLLAWGPRRLVVAHGACARDGAAEILSRALAWLG